VKPAALLAMLQGIYRDRLQLAADHLASARRVGQYQFNNTYQYLIAREETHLQWLAEAVHRLGGELPGPATTAEASGPEREIMEADRQREQAFVDRWRPRVAEITHARHRKMLEVVLGESLEHVRFFGEAVAGHADLLGRSATGAGRRGTVLSGRWVE
jgi:hypothetical protein